MDRILRGSAVLHVVLVAPVLLALTACTLPESFDLTNTSVDAAGYEI